VHHRTQKEADGGRKDQLLLEVTGLVANVFTGIYSEETRRPQPLRISVRAALEPPESFAPATPLSASFDYMHVKHAATTEIETAGHFQLVEAVADHICGSIFARCSRVTHVAVSIVKLALSEASEEIGITLERYR
jgi:dihydroneopterin aldolase